MKCCCLFPLNSFTFLSEDLTLSISKLHFCWKHCTSLQLSKNNISSEMPCFVEKHGSLNLSERHAMCACYGTIVRSNLLSDMKRFGTNFCPGVGRLLESAATIWEPFIFPFFPLNRFVSRITIYIYIYTFFNKHFNSIDILHFQSIQLKALGLKVIFHSIGFSYSYLPMELHILNWILRFESPMQYFCKSSFTKNSTLWKDLRGTFVFDRRFCICKIFFH